MPQKVPRDTVRWLLRMTAATAYAFDAATNWRNSQGYFFGFDQYLRYCMQRMRWRAAKAYLFHFNRFVRYDTGYPLMDVGREQTNTRAHCCRHQRDT